MRPNLREDPHANVWYYELHTSSGELGQPALDFGQLFSRMQDPYTAPTPHQHSLTWQVRAPMTWCTLIGWCFPALLSKGKPNKPPDGTGPSSPRLNTLPSSYCAPAALDSSLLLLECLGTLPPQDVCPCCSLSLPHLCRISTQISPSHWGGSRLQSLPIPDLFLIARFTFQHTHGYLNLK